MIKKTGLLGGLTTLCALCLALIFACSHERAQPAQPFPSIRAGPTPLDDAYYRKFPPPAKGPYLEEPISCDTLYSYYGAEDLMPDSMLKRIEAGKGLPEVYYATHRVPKNFCRPVNHVWEFLESHERFYDAVPATYGYEHLSNAETRAIEHARRSLPPDQRTVLRWTKTGSSLYLFLMEPDGLVMGRDYPYKILGSGGGFIHPDTGNYIQLPGY